MKCKICSNTVNNQNYKIKELMFGFKTEFDYMECSKCGCLQILKIPDNIEDYYLSNYYSFQKRPENSIKLFFIKKMDKYNLLKKDLIGKLLNIIYPNSLCRFEILSEIGKLDVNSKILDIGCGDGKLLNYLSELGLNNLIGIDPYINEEIKLDNLKIFKKNILEMSNNYFFDFIILSHAFEHMPNQLETLTKISNILSKNGTCLLSMPVKTEYIWEKYDINWVQIDAPRHFFIHTLESFKFLLKNTDLVLKKIVFNSNEFLFWGSEQYKRDIPLKADNSYYVNPQKSIFTEKQIKNYKKTTKKLNKENSGDQAIFILKKK